MIIGAGGHGRVIADCALESGQYTDIAFLDDDEKIKEVLGFSVIGKIQDAAKFVEQYEKAIVAIGNNFLRVKLIENLKEYGYHVPIVIHPAATVSKFSELQEGTVVMAGAVINAGVKIGIGGIVNTCASVDHDCVLGNGVHVSPGARLGGTVNVGDFVWICIGASVRNDVCIKSEAIVGAGAVVLKDIAEAGTYVGVPARKVDR